MTDTTPRQGVATFDYAAWAAAFPELSSSVPQAAAQERFNMATLYLDNSAYSPVPDVSKRAQLLGLLVAHLSVLLNPSSQGGRGAGAVGRVASATRGSVSTSFDVGSTSGDETWFAQTQYGWSFWMATAYLRQMRIIPGRSPRPHIFP